MRKHIFLVIMVLIGYCSQAQSNKITYTLNQMIDSALMHYSVSLQKGIYDQQSTLNLQNIETGYYPTFNLNGQASYQSDVTKLNVPIPGFTAPEISKDWYKLNLDITQMIYDGGNRKGQQSVEEYMHKGQINAVVLQEYRYREMVTKLYFRELLFNQNINVLKSNSIALLTTLKELEAAFKAGMVLQADVNAIKAENLILKQKIIETENNKLATLNMLAAYTGISLNIADSLQIPVINIEQLVYINLRPEYTQLNLQQSTLDKKKSVISVKQRPIIQAYGQLGYGRPGLNMLDDNFTGYYITGVRLNYKFWDWNTAKHEKQILGLQQQVLETEKQNFELNLRANYLAQLQEIEKINQLLASDQEIISLQSTVVDASKKRLQNGVITTAAYIQEFEKFTKSQIDFETNKIKLVNAKIDYMFLTGNFNTNE